MGSGLTSTAVTESTLQSLRTQLYPWQHLPSISIWQRPKWRTQTNIRCVRKTERKGKRKYPSERRKPREKQVDTGETKNRQDGYWRFVKVPVPVEKDPGKDHIGVSDALMEAIARYIKFPGPQHVTMGGSLADCSHPSLAGLGGFRSSEIAIKLQSFLKCAGNIT